MTDKITPNAPRASTGRLGSLSQTGQFDPAGSPSTAKKAKTDTLRLSPQAAETQGAGDLAQVKDLAKAVGALQDEQRAVGELQARIQAMVPGGVKFDTDGGASWKSTELKNLLEVLEAMSPQDRQSLSGMNFVRSDKVAMDDQGAAAAAQQLGADFTQGGAGATSQVDGAPRHEGFMSRLGDFVRHSADVLEGIPVLRYIGKALKSMFGQQAPERAIVLGNSGALISKGVWAHEIGHQVQMANRGWNPERIAEFAKLSGWTEHYADGHASAADGVNDQTGEKLMFDAKALTAQRDDNFVSAYAKTGPAEDFAESYRSYTLDPRELMRSAPEKFLFLNAQSQRYSAAEVKAMAQQTGTDLDQIATELVVHSSLKQATLNALVQANGLTPDRAAVVADAAAQVGRGDPLSQAWAKLAIASRDPAAAAALLQDPAQAMGELWNSLGEPEKAILSDPAFLQARLTELQAGTASTRSATDATHLEAYRQATGELTRRLLSDEAFRKALAADPAAALRQAGLADTLPPAIAQNFARNPQAVQQLVNQLGSTLGKASAAELERYRANLERALPALSPENFEAFAAALNNPKDPALAGRMLVQALETGSVVYQGGGEPPIA